MVMKAIIFVGNEGPTRADDYIDKEPQAKNELTSHKAEGQGPVILEHTFESRRKLYPEKAHIKYAIFIKSTQYN